MTTFDEDRVSSERAIVDAIARYRQVDGKSCTTDRVPPGIARFRGPEHSLRIDDLRMDDFVASAIKRYFWTSRAV
jgi:hypothetical protein